MPRKRRPAGRQAWPRPAHRRGRKLSSRRRSPLYHPPRRQPRWARRHHRSTHAVFQRNRRRLDHRPRRSPRAPARQPGRPWTVPHRRNRHFLCDRLDGLLSYRRRSLRLLGSRHRPHHDRPRVSD